MSTTQTLRLPLIAATCEPSGETSRIAPVVGVERPRDAFAIHDDERVGLGPRNQKALAVG